MIDWIGYLIFLAIGISCVYLSIKLLRTRITFTNATTIPYLAICTVQVIVCTAFNFLFPTIEYWLILSIFTVGLFVSECIFTGLLKKGHLSCLFNSPPEDTYKTNTFFNITIILIILYALYSTYNAIRSVDTSLLLQDEFQDEYQNSDGGSLYMRLTMMILSVYLLVYRKELKWRILGIVAFLPNLVVNTKGIILIQFLAIFTLLLLYNKIKNIPRLTLYIGLTGFVIFFGSYLYEGILSNWDVTDGDFFTRISIKLYSYLTSGVQAFSYNVAHEGEWIYAHFPNATIVPFNSFLAKFGLAQTYGSVTDYAVPTGFPLATSNVNSMYGTLFLFDGVTGGILILSFWTGLACFLRFQAFRTNNPLDMSLFGLFYAAFLLAWFDLYFMQPFWIYLIVITYLFKIVFNKKLWLSRRTVLH